MYTDPKDTNGIHPRGSESNGDLPKLKINRVRSTVTEDAVTKMGTPFKNIFLVSLNNRINGTGMRNMSSLQRERKRQLSLYSTMIHPFSNFRWYWDIWMTVLLIAALIAQPLQIAFYSTGGEEENVAVIVISTLVAIVFFVDIFFNFRTGIQDTQSEIIIFNKKKIARTYLRSWFLIDVFSSIPFDAVYYIILQMAEFGASEHFYYKIIRLLGLLKVFRLFRVIQCLKRIEKAFKISEVQTRLINLLVMILTILHWLACWHWLVADLCNPPGHRKEFNWITRTKLWDKPNWFRYINAALRAISNMGCLGYGGFAGEAPAEPEDIIATLVSIMIGATCFALYIGTMASIVQSINASEKKFAEVILEVNEYMKHRNIPKDVQYRVRTYYDQRYKRHYFDEPMIMESVSDILRNDMQMYNCQHLVEKVQLFNTVPASILRKIVAKLKFEVYLPGDEIIQIQTVGEAMYFIQEGECHVIDENGTFVTALTTGDFFGEVSLVLEQKTNASVVAANYCDVYRLEKHDFVSVFHEDNHDDILAQIRAVAQVRTEDTLRRKTDMSSSSLQLPTLDSNERFNYPIE